MIQNKHRPKHQLLADELRERIASGQWVPGEAIPSETELCAQTGTSRGTVRHALATLRSEGLLSGGQGKPPVVAAAVPSQSFSTFMSFTQWAQSMGRRPGQRTLELARRPATELEAAQLGVAADAMIVQVLRLRLLDGIPAMIERTSFESETGRLLFDFDTDSGSIFSYLREQGVDLSRARHTIDAVAANDEDCRLLGVPVGTPLLRERRLTSTSTGEAKEYSDDRYLPHLANFTIENSNDQRTALTRASSETVPTAAPLTQGESS